MNRTKNITIKQRLMHYVLTVLTFAAVCFTVVPGGVAMGFTLKLTNELQDSQIKEIKQQVEIRYAERMAASSDIANTIENYNMTSEPQYNLQSYLAYMLKENEDLGIYDYHEENKIIESVTKRINSIETFADSTKSTSKECVDMSLRLYQEADTMHEIIGQFEL